MTAFDVSVVCSTYNRPDRLRSLVAGLEAQTLDKSRFEVVIVDNGSAEATAHALDDIEARTALNFRRVTLAKNRGASGGRNAGWQAATAPVIAFTDDDCVPSPEWLERGLEAMAAPGVVAAVGRTIPDPAKSANAGPFTRNVAVSQPGATTFLPTCNIFYRRDRVAEVGGFDERFATKGGEDTDLGWRVLDLSGEAVFAESALVLHDVHRGGFRAAVREATTWTDIPLVKARHPRRARPTLQHNIFWKPSHEYAVVALASIGVAAVFRNVLPLSGVLPWAWYRVKRNPISRRNRADRLVYLPHAFVIDALEVSTMIRGSLRHKTLVL